MLVSHCVKRLVSFASTLSHISRIWDWIFDLCINVVISNLVVLGSNLLRALCSEVFIVLPFTLGGFISFFTVVNQTISALICLFVVEGMAQDTTAQIRSSWRFLNSTHLYTNKKKTTLVTVLLLMLPHSGMICLMMYVLLQLLFQEKN